MTLRELLKRLGGAEDAMDCDPDVLIEKWDGSDYLETLDLADMVLDEDNNILTLRLKN